MDKGVSSSPEDIDQADPAWNKKRGHLPAHPPPSCRALYNFLGYLGKVNFPAPRHREQTTRLRRWSGVLSVAIVLAACEVQELPSSISGKIGTGRVYALNGLEGRWSGTVRSDDPSCGSSIGLMTIRGDKFAFDPFQSTTVIRGTISKLGSLRGNFSSTGENKVPFHASFDGESQRNQATEQSVAIVGTLRSGPCRWAVRLRRS